MKTTIVTLRNAGNIVNFTIKGKKALMTNSKGESLAMTNEEASDRVSALVRSLDRKVYEMVGPMAMALDCLRRFGRVEVDVTMRRSWCQVVDAMKQGGITLTEESINGNSILYKL